MSDKLREAIESYRDHIDGNCLQAPTCLIEAEAALADDDKLRDTLIQIEGIASEGSLVSYQEENVDALQRVISVARAALAVQEKP